MTISPAGLTGTDAVSSVPAGPTGELYGGTTKPVILLYLASSDFRVVDFADILKVFTSGDFLYCHVRGRVFVYGLRIPQGFRVLFTVAVPPSNGIDSSHGPYLPK